MKEDEDNVHISSEAYRRYYAEVYDDEPDLLPYVPFWKVLGVVILICIAIVVVCAH
jgi:hypothetical protein